MAKDPAFLFYYQDFFTGVSDMTNEEIGAYMKCLCIQASKGGITERHMKLICNSSETHSIVKIKFELNSETQLYENNRLKVEIDKRRKYSESRSINRKKPNKSKENDIVISDSYVKHMEDEDENENKDTIDNNIIYKEALLKNENWIKTIATESKKTEEEVKQKLEGFIVHLATELKIHPSVNEFAKHFKYWLPKNTIENGKSNSSSKSNSNNGYKPAKVDREKLIRELAEDAANGNIPGDYSQRRT
jgi:hypothetical protein